MHALFALLLCFTQASPAWAASPDRAATVISMEGPAWVEGVGAKREALDVGDLLDAGDRLLTGEAAQLHLALADGSSLVLGPNTDLSLEALGDGEQGSNSIFKLAKGLLNAMVQKLRPGARFEVQTSNAIAAVKGTDFEVSAADDDTRVTVQEGEVAFGDSFRRKQEAVHPDQQARLMAGRLLGAKKLSKRELGAYRARWERSRMIHGQRARLLKQYRSDDKAQRARLKKRRAQRSSASPRHRMEEQRRRWKKDMGTEAPDKKKKKRLSED